MMPQLPKSYRISITTFSIGVLLLVMNIFLTRYSTVPDDEVKSVVSYIMLHAGWLLIVFSAIYTRLMYARHADFRHYFKKHVFEHFAIGAVEPQDEREQLMKLQAGYEMYAILTSVILLSFFVGYIFPAIKFTWHYFGVLLFIMSGVYYWKLFRKGVEIRDPKAKNTRSPK